MSNESNSQSNSYYYRIFYATDNAGSSYQLMEYPIFYVRWEDHFEVSEWTDIATHKALPYINTTVGFLIKKDRKHYVVARTLTPDGMADGIMNIMRKNVVELRELK